MQLYNGKVKLCVTTFTNDNFEQLSTYIFHFSYTNRAVTCRILIIIVLKYIIDKNSWRWRSATKVAMALATKILHYLVARIPLHVLNSQYELQNFADWYHKTFLAKLMTVKVSGHTPVSCAFSRCIIIVCQLTYLDNMFITHRLLCVALQQIICLFKSSALCTIKINQNGNHDVAMTNSLIRPNGAIHQVTTPNKKYLITTKRLR